MAINFPTWVTNQTAIPAAYLVPAKKLLYTLAACEYARQLHNAGWKWIREESLTAGEQAILQAEFPAQWPNAPTETQFRNYLTNQWEPRQNEAHGTLAASRQRTENFDLSWVDWDSLI